MEKSAEELNAEAINELFGDNTAPSSTEESHTVIAKDTEGNYVINQYLLTQVMNGMTNGEANAIAAIMVNNYENPEEPLAVDELVCDNTEVQIHCMGGCLIAELFFTETTLYEDALQISREYLSNLTNRDYDNDIFVLSLIPTRVSYVNMLAWNLIYVDGYENNGIYKLILGFDNNKTQTIISDELNLETIAQQLEMELNKEQFELEAKIAELEKEEKKDTYFDDMFQDIYSDLSEEEKNHDEE